MKLSQKITAALSAVAVALGMASASAAPYTEESNVELASSGTAARGSIAIIPDTQFYSRYGQAGNDLYAQQYGPDLPNPFDSQTQWIADNAADYNIDMTMHLGDVTDQAQPAEYDVATRAMGILDAANVPYSIIPGNHDMPGYGSDWYHGGNWNPYLSYFSPEKQAEASTFGGSNAEAGGDGASNWHVFEVAGVKMMSVNIADTASFDWANAILAANPNVPTIITSHTNLGVDEGNTAVPDDFGELLWDQVINKHPQVFLTYNGHHHGATNTVRYINDDPNLPVFQQLIDYQMFYQGGNGLMSLAEFDFTNNQLSQTSFSPWVLEKPKDKLTSLDFALLEGKGATYTVEMDFAKRFAAIGADFNPTAERVSSTEKLRTYLTENFTAPEGFDLMEPKDGDDYVKAEGTVAHWRPEQTDAGIVMRDITGLGNDMTLQRAEQSELTFNEGDHYAYSSGLNSVTMNPNGKKEFAYFSTADGAPVNSLEFPEGYTIETFLKMSPDAPDTWRSLLTRTGNYDGGEPPATITVSNLNEVQWAAGEVDHMTSSNWSGEIFKDQWYHVAVVFDSATGERQLYVDGNPMLRTPGERLGDGLATMDLPWIIGGGNWDGNPDNAWYGTVGETRIIDRPTSRDEWLTARPMAEEPTPEPTPEPSEPAPTKPGKGPKKDHPGKGPKKDHPGKGKGPQKDTPGHGPKWVKAA